MENITKYASEKYVDDSITDNSLTDEELFNVLDETDYLIPINVKVYDFMGNILFKNIEISDINDNIIFQNHHYEYAHSIDTKIFITKEVIDNGVEIYINHDYGAVSMIKMNNNILTENNDYEVERNGINGNYTSIITFKKITGDIEIEIPVPPPS